MQLLVDSETSVDIENKMAALNEALNGKAANNLVDEISNSVNDNKENVENVIANEDSSNSNKGETKEPSDSALDLIVATNENDFNEKTDAISTTQEEGEPDLSNKITEEILEFNDCSETEKHPEVKDDNSEPVVITQTKFSIPSPEEASKPIELTESKSSQSVTQNISDAAVSEDGVKNISKDNELIEITQTQSPFHNDLENIVESDQLKIQNIKNENLEKGLQIEKNDHFVENIKDDNATIKNKTPENAVIPNEENTETSVNNEKNYTDQESNDISMSDDTSMIDIASNEEPLECNKIINTESSDITSQETVTKNGKPKEAQSLIEENNSPKTVKDIERKENVNIEESNIEAPKSKDVEEETTNLQPGPPRQKESVMKDTEIEKQGDLDIETNADINDSKKEVNHQSLLNFKIDNDGEDTTKDPNQCENNESRDDKEKEAEKLTSEAPIETEQPSSRLKEILTQTSSRLRLSNTMNILSDDDDDCMLIDEVPSEPKPENTSEKQNEQSTPIEENSSEILEEKLSDDPQIADNFKLKGDDKQTPLNEDEKSPIITEKEPEKIIEEKPEKPLIPKAFLQNCKRKLSDMTRDDLEEFCVLKIAEAVIDRTNLSDVKSKLKLMAQNIEEYKKKSTLLTRQNRDLQVVLKSVQEEQKKRTNVPITPLKITRSVGMQVVMVDKPVRRKAIAVAQIPTVNNNPSPSPAKVIRNNTINNQRQSAGSNNQIPVPRLVPAQSFTSKAVSLQNSPKIITNNIPNGTKKSQATPPKAEKRPLNRSQSTSQSDTVDLTEDEPPAKTNRTATANMPVRLVQQQSLMAPRIPNPAQTNNQRKVYIPISSNHTDGLKVGQKIMLRSVTPPGSGTVNPIVRGQTPTKVMRLPHAPVRLPRPNMTMRHPAPLPDTHKQYQPPTWKSIPPAPDLKLSKVENGIVISWKIDGYMEDQYEEIASYQLYAYQETTAAPSTLLWKKIGDVKALPLPMACTLTQFMAGYKYYFAVRAVDVKSRVGPFSMPGSILLLNKV